MMPSKDARQMRLLSVAPGLAVEGWPGDVGACTWEAAADLAGQLSMEATVCRGLERAEGHCRCKRVDGGVVM